MQDDPNNKGDLNPSEAQVWGRVSRGKSQGKIELDGVDRYIKAGQWNFAQTTPSMLESMKAALRDKGLWRYNIPDEPSENLTTSKFWSKFVGEWQLILMDFPLDDQGRPGERAVNISLSHITEPTLVIFSDGESQHELATWAFERFSADTSGLSKDAIYKEVFDLVQRATNADGVALVGAAAYWALAGHVVLYQYGVRSVIQAGSASWPKIDMKNDDGKMDTHFTYKWEPEGPTGLVRTLTGHLPEMHVWLGLPDVNEVVDFSTKFIPKSSLEMGFDWPGPPLPDYYWLSAPVAHVHYDVVPEASEFLVNTFDNSRSPGIKLLVDYARKEHRRHPGVDWIRRGA